MKILILGSTGMLGFTLLSELTNHTNFKLYATYRDDKIKKLLVKKNIGTKDPKTKLQEYMQSLGMILPIYETIHIKGPPHQPSFKITCKVPLFKEIFESISTTVREGQQTVSKIILDKINEEK